MPVLLIDMATARRSFRTRGGLNPRDDDGASTALIDAHTEDGGTSMARIGVL